MTDSMGDDAGAAFACKLEEALLLLGGRRVARWMKAWRIRQRSRGCRILVIGSAETDLAASGDPADEVIRVLLDAETLTRELTAAAGLPRDRLAGPEVLDQVIERIVGEVYVADMVILSAAHVGPAELVVAGAVDGLGGTLSLETDVSWAAIEQHIVHWERPTDGWTPKAIARPSVAQKLEHALHTALSAPVAVTFGAPRQGGAR